MTWHRLSIAYDGPADPAAFDEHYASVHVPLVRQVPGVVRFLVSHPRGLGADAPYFVAELWFDSADDLRTALRSPEMAACAADAEGFDVAAMRMHTGEIGEPDSH